MATDTDGFAIAALLPIKAIISLENVSSETFTADASPLLRDYVEKRNKIIDTSIVWQVRRKIEKNESFKGLTVTTPTAYLQTLAKDEAIAFVASLQKVKTHLSHELAWMSQQVQQKTVQLQSLEALLSEAAALGLVNEVAHPTGEPIAAGEPTTVAAIAASIATKDSGAIALPGMTTDDLDPASNGTVVPTEPTASTASEVTPLPPTKKVQGKRGSQPATKKSSAAPGSSQPTATSKASQLARSTQPFVRSQFQDQSITDAVGNILKRSQTPLSADEIMAVLYEGLAGEAYKRAKNSVTNILSVGRGKEKWKSTGRGLYADNAVVSA